jgi:hypothetical protein
MIRLDQRSLQNKMARPSRELNKVFVKVDSSVHRVVYYEYLHPQRRQHTNHGKEHHTAQKD